MVFCSWRFLGTLSRRPLRYTNWDYPFPSLGLRARTQLEFPIPAFFCVMIPASVWNKVGPLDEAYGIGMFEDDDYAMRVRQAGFEIACAEDVFIHHHLSATFDSLGEKEKFATFDKNRKYFESKWGLWKPHKQR